MNESIVWLDTETGGLDPTRHQLTQIAAIATTGHAPFEIIAEHEDKIQLMKGHWNQEALNLSSYDPDIWKEEAVKEVAAINKLKAFAKGFTHEKISGRTGRPYQCAHAAGQNIVFDADFIRAAAERYDIWMPLSLWTGGMFDTVQLVMWYASVIGRTPENYQLKTIYEWIGLGTFEAHDALEDTRACIDIANFILDDWRLP